MSGPKTLKEMVHQKDQGKEELKKEAVKWVNAFKSAQVDYVFKEADEIINWIRHFFNIEEKENDDTELHDKNSS